MSAMDRDDGLGTWQVLPQHVEVVCLFCSLSDKIFNKSDPFKVRRISCYTCVISQFHIGKSSTSFFSLNPVAP